MDIFNNVIINMDDKLAWWAIIKKGKFDVIIFCDLSSNTIYTYGGSNMNICKNIKHNQDQKGMYDSYMRKIGKMCKKEIDANGHYFSNNDGYVDEVIPTNIETIIHNLYIRYKL